MWWPLHEYARSGSGAASADRCVRGTAYAQRTVLYMYMYLHNIVLLWCIVAVVGCLGWVKRRAPSPFT